MIEALKAVFGLITGHLGRLTQGNFSENTMNEIKTAIVFLNKLIIKKKFNNTQGDRMKSLFVIVSLISTVGFALDMSAQKWTAQLDLRQTASDAAGNACTGTCKADTQTMFSAGATTWFDLGNQFGLRTGGAVTQRGYKQTDATGTNAANFTYLDIPVLPEYQINDMFTAYAGVVVGLKASRTCDFGTVQCERLTDKSLVTPLQVGGTYNIDKQWAARLTYETGTLMTADTTTNADVKTANVITLGGGYTF